MVALWEHRDCVKVIALEDSLEMEPIRDQTRFHASLAAVVILLVGLIALTVAIAQFVLGYSALALVPVFVFAVCLYWVIRLMLSLKRSR